MKATELYSENIINKIAEYEAYDKFNDFLYKNKGCDEIFTDINNGKDRFILVNASNRLSKELTPEISSIFHNKKCVVNGIEGIIEHPLTITYQEEELTNETSFRKGIALWVNTGNSLTTHLYNASEIEIIQSFKYYNT